MEPRPLIWTLVEVWFVPKLFPVKKVLQYILANDYTIYLPAVDAVALRITFISFSILGEFERMRDMFARSVIHWTEDMQLYPYILGL